MLVADHCHVKIQTKRRQSKQGEGRKMGERMRLRKERRKEQTERLVVGEEMDSDSAGQVDE